MTFAAKLLLAGATVALTTTSALAQGRPMYNTTIESKNDAGEVVEDKIYSFYDGPSCAETVKTNFRAKYVGSFTSSTDDESLTARIMNNVARIIRTQCGQASLIRATGKISFEQNGEKVEKTVYSGVADKATDWLVVEVGVRNSGGFLSTSTRNGEEPELPAYLKQSSFLKYGDMQASISDAPILCTNHNASQNTCTLVTEFKDKTESGSTMVTRQMLDDEGAIGEVTLSGTVSDGLWCGNPQEAIVTATGGNLTAGSKSQQAMEEMLLERVQDNGNQVCVGYAKTSNGLTTTQFDADGFQLYAEMPLTAMAAAPSLRRE